MAFFEGYQRGRETRRRRAQEDLLGLQRGRETKRRREQEDLLGLQRRQQIDINKAQEGRRGLAFERGVEAEDRKKTIQNMQLLNQSATALSSLEDADIPGAYQRLAPMLQGAGIDDLPGQAPSRAQLKEIIAATQGVIAIPDSPIKRTSLQQNLIAAGLEPGTKQFQNAVLAATQKPSTQVTIGGEKKFAEEVAKGQAKTFSRIGGEADAAIDANQSLDVLEAIDVDTGALEPAKQGIAAFANAFGLDASGLANVSKGEAFNAEAQRIVLAVKASQKGPQTDKDEATIRKTVANLGNTKAGNQFIINSARALNNRRIERKDFYDRFVEDAGGQFRNDQGVTADRAWAKFKRETPMISSKLRTPQGLPVFFFEFERDVRQANPDALRKEIIEIWNQKNRGSK